MHRQLAQKYQILASTKVQILTHRMHRQLSHDIKEHLLCEHVVLHEFVSPWDVLSSLNAQGAFQELPASVGVAAPTN